MENTNQQPLTPVMPVKEFNLVGYGIMKTNTLYFVSKELGETLSRQNLVTIKEIQEKTGEIQDSEEPKEEKEDKPVAKTSGSNTKKK